MIYTALVTNLDKPTYARAWEEDMGSTWTTSDWFCVSKRASKGILNASLIEASLKVLTRWYYVPSRLAVIYPGTSPLCFRGCELEGTMLHILWTCPRMRYFWQKVFRTINSTTNETVAPDPNSYLPSAALPTIIIPYI